MKLIYSQQFTWETIPKPPRMSQEWWDKLGFMERKREYSIGFWDYKYTIYDLRNARKDFDNHFRRQNRDPLDFDLNIYAELNHFSFFFKKKFHVLDKQVLMRYDFEHSEFYNNGSEILTGDLLEHFKQTVHLNMLKSFDRSSRTFRWAVINTQSIYGRCLHCSRKLVGMKYKPLKYCKGLKTNCGYAFYYKYDWSLLAYFIVHRDKHTCQLCGKTKLKKYDIDHIKEISSVDDPIEQAKLFMDTSNLQTLCKECHKQKTADYLKIKFTKPVEESEEAQIPAKKYKPLLSYLEEH